LSHRWKVAVFWGVLILIPLVIVECLAFVHSRLQYGLYSGAHRYLPTITPELFAQFVASPRFDAELGWTAPSGSSVRRRENCVGNLWTATYEQGYRVGLGPAGGGDGAVALYGDSFVAGDEVNDNQTIASALYRKYGMPSLNFGVSAYGADQATLRFKKTLREGFRFSTAVLVVMHDDIRRMANSIRGVIGTGSTDPGLKPYVRHGKYVPLNYPKDYASFVEEAYRRFREDYWARPEARFPYTISLIRALWTPSFISRVMSAWRDQSFEYLVSNELRDSLQAVVFDFVETARANGIQPVVVFIPASKHTYRISEDFVARLNRALGNTLVYEFADDSVDWTRFNLSADGIGCHPSPYGYEKLADFIADAIEHTKAEEAALTPP
jgi:hypothetical protein